MSDFRNPETFLGRFVCHFALAFSACLVSMLILHLVGRLDPAMGAIWSFGFSSLFGLIRARLARPGTPFWGSPFSHKDQ